MKPKQPPLNIYQSRNGISLIDGYYLVRNPGAKTVAVISIAQGVVSVHSIKSQMSLQNLVNMDASGYLDIFGELKLIEPEKNKTKK